MPDTIKQGRQHMPRMKHVTHRDGIQFLFPPILTNPFLCQNIKKFLMNKWAPRARSSFHHAHTREPALGETMPVSAHLIPPPLPPAFCCSLKRTLKSALWSPARAMAIASLHLSLKRKVLPNSPTQAVSSGLFPRLCGSGVGSGPQGRQEMCAGSLPRWCDFIHSSRAEGDERLQPGSSQGLCTRSRQQLAAVRHRNNAGFAPSWAAHR